MGQIMVSDARQQFAHLFRTELARELEYSHGNDAALEGIMLSGSGSAFLDRITEFSDSRQGGDQWSRAAKLFTNALQPDGFFFKVDWRGINQVEQLTLYCRYRGPIGDRSFTDALRASTRFTWGGPPPSILAEAVNETGPCIIGLRIDGADRYRTALYFRLLGVRSQVLDDHLPTLLARLRIPSRVAVEVADTAGGLTAHLYPSMVGVDSPTDSVPTLVKLDVAGVFLRDAMAFAAHRGADPAHLAAIAAIARAARLQMVNYVGLKFGSNGYAGWKLYLPVRPLDHGAIGPVTRLADASDYRDLPLDFRPWEGGAQDRITTTASLPYE